MEFTKGELLAEAAILQQHYTGMYLDTGRRVTLESTESMLRFAAQLVEERERNRTDGPGPDGAWICETCGFVAMKLKLRASDMAVGIDVREVQDICPNDGTSLRRKTWREDALDSDRAGIQHMKRADAAETALARVSALPEQLIVLARQVTPTSQGESYSAGLRRASQMLTAALASLDGETTRTK